MSRSGYSHDLDQWELIKWRGQVAAAMRGKRGQAFLLDLVHALDAMPLKRLIAKELQKDGEVCAIGSVGIRRSIALDNLDPEDHSGLSEKFDIATQLVQEVEWVNDEAGPPGMETPEQRWERVRAWAVAQLLPVEAGEGGERG